MCGRYQFGEDAGRAVRRLAAAADPALEQMRYGDIYPSEAAVILSERGGGLYAEPMHWGFPAAQSKQLLINARAETALQKPSFSDSVMRRRCVIPASGFYEWDAKKRRAAFTRPEHSSLYMAGFYRMFEGGKRFVILTAAANESVSPVHDRMPLILEESELEDWILEDGRTAEFLRKAGPLLRAEFPGETPPAYEQLSLF